jgi:hypothetical protein
MCRFYSFLTDKKGNRYAMGHDIRLKIRNIDWGYLTLAEQQNRKISVIITDTDVESDSCDYGIAEIYIAE